LFPPPHFPFFLAYKKQKAFPFPLFSPLFPFLLLWRKNSKCLSRPLSPPPQKGKRAPVLKISQSNVSFFSSSSFRELSWINNLPIPPLFPPGLTVLFRFSLVGNTKFHPPSLFFTPNYLPPFFGEKSYRRGRLGQGLLPIIPPPQAQRFLRF